MFDGFSIGEVHMIDLSRVRGALWLAPVALTLTACDATAPKTWHPGSRSVTTKGAPGVAVPAGSGMSAAIQIGSGANSLTSNQAQVVLARIELSTAGGCAATGEEDDCAELRLGPTLVDLPVDATTQVMLEDVAIPAGTYSGVQAKLDAVQPDDDEPGVSAFLTAHPDFQGISVKVTGVFTDASSATHDFTFTSEIDAEMAMRFEPPVTLASDTKNLTIAVDIASWFKDASGAVIDPTDPANAEAIERNILRSARVFEDDDHDGVDDHDEQGDGNHEQRAGSGSSGTRSPKLFAHLRQITPE